MTPAIPISAVDQTATPAVFTRWVNFLDLCALALPNGFHPFGVLLVQQIVCRGGEEAMCHALLKCKQRAKSKPLLGQYTAPKWGFPSSVFSPIPLHRGKCVPFDLGNA